MKNRATLFNSRILGNWVKQLHEEIPKEVQRFRDSTDKTWETWQERLVLAISQNSPGLAGRHLAQQATKLSVIKEDFKNSVSDTVTQFVAEGPKARANLVDEMTAFWEPGFSKADGVLGGSGVTTRKQEALSEFSRRHGEKAFEVPVAAVQKKIESGLEKLGPGFDSSLSRLLDKVRLQSQLFSRNMTEKEGTQTMNGESSTSGEGETPRGKLMAQLRAGCLQWSEAWHGQDFENLEERPDDSVPRQWRSGKELAPIEDADSESESTTEDDSETDEGATKLDEQDVMYIKDEDSD
jgi:hypothetical protein